MVARAALELLNEVGLDGLTMRQVAARLNVQAAALYWHVENKRQLLDAMATTMYIDAVEGMEAPRRGESWQQWVIVWATRLRRTLLRYRDGARVFAGTATDDAAVYRTTELILRTLQDAGFSLRDAARGFPVVLHYVIGFTIEEQARMGLDYGNDNPYRPGHLASSIDSQRFPLTAQAHPDLFAADTDTPFTDGLHVILTGLRSTYLSE
ncbi:TetR/AcrR family transcriptional regulator C-terminal domain-containing protein [Nocardia transvalensis]|nr:TetR/AcrR family transcriptional regulator C-terminal domain-containing protein [Nocardia transvalensis]